MRDAGEPDEHAGNDGPRVQRLVVPREQRALRRCQVRAACKPSAEKVELRQSSRQDSRSWIGMTLAEQNVCIAHALQHAS